MPPSRSPNATTEVRIGPARRWPGHPLRPRRLRWPEARIMAAFAALVAILWGFVWLAEEVMEGDTHAVDTRLLLLLRTPNDPADPLGPLWFEQMARDFTGLGSVGVLTLVTVVAVLYLILTARRRAALLVAACICGGWLVTEGLKLGFDRPRPDLVPHGAMVFTASFPSSHASMSAIVYLTLGALLARLQQPRTLKVYVMATAVSLTLLVGFSRVYLAVHWPSDVLAGWSVGAAWALMCWLALRWLQRRGQVRSDPPPAAGGG